MKIYNQLLMIVSLLGLLITGTIAGVHSHEEIVTKYDAMGKIKYRYVKDSYIVVLKKKNITSYGIASTETLKERALRLVATTNQSLKSTNKSSASSIASASDAVANTYDAIDGFAVHMNEEQKKILEQNNEVKYIQTNYIHSINKTQLSKEYEPIDTLEVDDALDNLDEKKVGIHEEPILRTFSSSSTSAVKSWGIDRINQVSLPLDNNATHQYSGVGVHAYIIDTGIRKTHEAFAGRIGDGYDAVHNDNDPSDDQGHGTHVAGSVGGTGYGVAQNVTLHAIKVLREDGYGSDQDIIEGMQWVIDHHSSPAVVNMSLGGSKDTALDNMVQELIDAGITVVVAAGNDNRDACNYSPASALQAITVAASGNGDNKAGFSNYGSCVDIYAPGVDIVSTYFKSDTSWGTGSGTSMASPHVAGAVALYLEENPSATPAQVAQYIVTHATQGIIKDNRVETPNKLLLVQKNPPTTAISQEILTQDGMAKDITLHVYHPVSSMTFTITHSPTHGTLSGTAPNLQYTPTQGYFGTDSFTFQVSADNQSTEATVTIENVDTSGCLDRPALKLLIDKGADVSDVNTSCTTDMHQLFFDNTTFNQDISKWDTSNVTNMRLMFRNAKYFNQPIGDWNVSKVITMENMFRSAHRFNQDISKWDTSNVRDMSEMFWGATDFNQPIGNWNTSKVTKMYSMFVFARSFNQPLNFDTSHITSMKQMFSGMMQMFANASSFNKPLHFDTSNITNMSSMFSGAMKFNQPIGNWDTSNVTSMSNMFWNATNFNQPIGNWDTSSVRRMNYMFCAAENFNQPIGNWNVSHVTNMDSMFGVSVKGGSTDMTIPFNQNIENWDTSSVTNMSGMFNHAKYFNQPIGNWDTSNVTDMSCMFYNAYKFNQPIGNWDTSNVRNMWEMFMLAKVFNQPIGNWNTSSVSKMDGMFYGTQFNQPINNWDTSKVTNMRIMFYKNKSFNQPIDKWNIENVTEIDLIFNDANYSSTENYSALLKSWSKQNVKENIDFGSIQSKYNCSAKEARAKLVNDKHWKIYDKGFDNSPCIEIEVEYIAGKNVNLTYPPSTTSSSNTPDINGTCTPNDTVTIQIDDANITPTKACSTAGTFSITPDSNISDGEHNVTATQVDADGNVTNAEPVGLTVNTVLPNYSIKSSARGSNIFTPQAQTRVVLTIVEKKGGINSSPLRVQLPKDNKFSLHYDSSLGSLNSKILDNSNWKVTEENEDKIILSYTGNNGIFNPHGSSIIGLEVDIKTPLNSDGMLNYQSLILPGSGEDYVLDRGDNSDYSSISYRNYNY